MERIDAEAVHAVLAAMAAQKLSIEDLGPRVGLSRHQMTRRLSGETSFTLNELDAIARVLGHRWFEFLPSTGDAA